MQVILLEGVVQLETTVHKDPMHKLRVLKENTVKLQDSVHQQEIVKPGIIAFKDQALLLLMDRIQP